MLSLLILTQSVAYRMYLTEIVISATKEKPSALTEIKMRVSFWRKWNIVYQDYPLCMIIHTKEWPLL